MLAGTEHWSPDPRQGGDAATGIYLHGQRCQATHNLPVRQWFSTFNSVPHWTPNQKVITLLLHN